MPEKDGLSLWQLVLRGIAGALVLHVSCNGLFWLFSFGPSFADVSKFALAQAIGPLVLGTFVGFLCNRCRINQSFWVAFVTMFLAILAVFLSSEYLSVPMSTPSVTRNMMVYSITVIIAGFAIALLLVGLIVAMRWITKR